MNSSARSSATGRLVELGALGVDVSAVAPARRRALESLGRRMTAQQLRRLEPARRHPLLLVLLQALVIERGDELLDLFDKLLRLTDGRARRRVDEQRRHALCLQLLVNAVQIWNARYMTAAIDHLHTAQPDVVADEHALARVAPVAHAHVNSLGRYELNRKPPPPATSDRYASTRASIEASRRRRSASVATNTKRWISRR